MSNTPVTSSVSESPEILYEVSQYFKKPLDQSSVNNSERSLQNNEVAEIAEGTLLQMRPKLLLPPLDIKSSNKVSSYLDLLLIENEQVVYGDINEWPSVADIAAGVNSLREFGSSFWLFRRPTELQFSDEAVFCGPTLTLYELRKENGLVVAPVHIRWKFEGIDVPNSPSIVNLRFAPLRQNGRTAWRLLPDVWWRVDSAEVLAITLAESARYQDFRQRLIRQSPPEQAAALQDDFYFYYNASGLQDLPSVGYLLKRYKKYVDRHLVQELLTKVAADRYHRWSRSDAFIINRNQQHQIRKEEVSILAPLAYEAAETVGDPVFIARAHYELLCSRLELWEDEDIAVAERENSLFQQSFKDNHNARALAYAIMANARLLQSQGRYTQASQSALESKKLLQQCGGDDYLQTEVSLALAFDCYAIGNFKAAEKYYKTAEDQATPTPGFRNPLGVLNSSRALQVGVFVPAGTKGKFPTSGMMDFYLTSYDFTAKSFLIKGIISSDYELSAYQRIVALQGRATVCFPTDRERSYKICQRGIFQGRQLGCLPLEEEFLQTIGQYWQQKNEAGKAVFYLRQALKVIEEKNGGVYSADERLHSISTTTDSPSKDLAWHWRAAELSDKVADAYFQLGEYNRSLTFYGRLLTHIREAPKETEADRQRKVGLSAHTHAMMAGAYIAMGAYEKAKLELRIASTISTQVKDQSLRAISLMKIAENMIDITYREENTDERNRILSRAETSLLQVRGIALSTKDITLQMDVYYRLGKLYGSKGQNLVSVYWYDKSLLLLQKSSDQHNSLKAACLNAKASHLIQLKREQEAESCFLESIQICRRYDIKATLYWALCGQGQILLARRKPKQAEVLFREAVNTIDQIREQTVDSSLQMSFSADTRWANDGYILSLLDQGRNEAAWKVSEETASRKLREIVSSGANLSQNSTELKESLSLENRADQLRQQIRSQGTDSGSRAEQQRRENLAQEYDGLLQQLAGLEQQTYWNSYSNPIPQVDAAPATLSQVTAALPDKTALVQYMVLNQREVVAFVIRRDQNGHPLLSTRMLNISPFALQEEIKRYMDDRVNGLRSFGNNPILSHDLYSKLIQPLETQLKGIQNLIVAPDKFLWGLPFQTLQINQQQEPLITRYAVSYVPSATVLIATQRLAKRNDQSRLQDAKHSGILILSAPGDLTGKTVKMSGKSNLSANPYLTYATQEVKAVAGEFPNRATIEPRSEDDNAGEGQWKRLATQYRYLHIISHGEFSDIDPLSSHLILAPDLGKGGDDGFLTAWEIASQRPRLKASLTVLSACETARGSENGGEGILGMTWAFLAAGSPSIIAGQWEINDQTAPEIMKTFYANLNAGKSKSEALRQAQLQAWRTGRKEPAYWAPYILVGAP